MKKIMTFGLVLIVSVCFLSAAGGKEEGTKAEPQKPVEAPAAAEAPAAEQVYYLTGSFNSYAVASPDYIMSKLDKDNPIYALPGFEDADLYHFTVAPENLKPDEVHDGHYYKVSLGDWDHVYGIESYELQPPPVHGSYGLGSIYIPIEFKGPLTVVFDAKTNKIYDNTMKQRFTPRLYGNFGSAFGMLKDWDMEEDGSILLEKKEEGVWQKTFTLPAYKGSADDKTGAEIFLVWSRLYFIFIGTGWDTMIWGASDQMAVAGPRAKAQEVFKPAAEATYRATFNEATGEATFEVVN